MNKITPFKLVLPPVRSRAHKVLFCENTPFKPKVEANKKKAYVRRPKHVKSQLET